ncbi:MAG: ABC transporter ATP-binding protein [Planctomycetes bacterium]|nr:ABC transporter ATP-binding protein [Planctomycetota bacterium]
MIEIVNFTKRYENFLAVDCLHLSIAKADIYGLIGPNGAGKTTTFKFLATLLPPSDGDAWVNGHSVVDDVKGVRRSIGYMPDSFGVYDGMRVWEFLDFFGVAYGIPKAKRKKIIDDILVLVDLSHKRDDLVNGLSRGMKQRLCLAKTLVHDPPVLILDEPASGLDPRARVEMKELLRELRNMGKTIVVSSHILSELADYCTKIGIIERGKLLANGDVKSILAQIRENTLIEIVVLDKWKEAETIAARCPYVKHLKGGGNTIRVEFKGALEKMAELHCELVSAGIPLLWFREVEPNLEEAFLKLTKGEVQ